MVNKSHCSTQYCHIYSYRIPLFMNTFLFLLMIWGELAIKFQCKQVLKPLFDFTHTLTNNCIFIITLYMKIHQFKKIVQEIVFLLIHEPSQVLSNHCLSRWFSTRWSHRGLISITRHWHDKGIPKNDSTFQNNSKAMRNSFGRCPMIISRTKT